MSTAAIIYLTQNNESRRQYLQSSLYFLFRNFNARYKYPVFIFHEGDYDACSQELVLEGIRHPYESLVSFRKLDDGDFSVPSHLDLRAVNASVDAQPVPWWRNLKYRLMCRWWLIHMPRYMKDFKYVMRLDDDSFIEEYIKEDLFMYAEKNNITYMYNILHLDNPICCFGMREFFYDIFPKRKNLIDQIFVSISEIVRENNLKKLNALERLVENLPCKMPKPPNAKLGEAVQMWAPIMFYNNFHISQPAFWLNTKVRKTIEAIDQHGGIFFGRWGDAPLQTIIAILHAAPEKIKRYAFRYSKRVERELKYFGNNHLSYFENMTLFDYGYSGSITEIPELRNYLEKLRIREIFID